MNEQLQGSGGFIANWGSNIRDSGRSPGKCACGFIAAWVAFFLILWVMPAPEGLSVAGKATLAVMVWACIMWITEAIPVGISGMLIPMLLVLSGAIDKFPKAASGFATPVVFLCLAAFIFAAVMQAAGLDRRIALALLHKLKAKTVNGVIWAMFAANMVLSLIIPAANARAATLLPVVNGITNMFGDTPEERLEAIIERDSQLSAAGRNRRRVTDVAVYTNYQLVSERGHGPGWVMTGDAFGFVDPMLSPGMWLALHSAELLTERLDDLPSYTREMRKCIKAWMELISSGSMMSMGSALGSADCTPGYYNNEGQPGAGFASEIAKGYPGGPTAFFQHLRRWCESGFEGIEFR